MIYWNCYIGDFFFFFKGSNFDYFAKRPQSWKSYFGPNHLLPRSKSYTRIQGSPDIGPCLGLLAECYGPHNELPLIALRGGPSSCLRDHDCGMVIWVGPYRPTILNIKPLRSGWQNMYTFYTCHEICAMIPICGRYLSVIFNSLLYHVTLSSSTSADGLWRSLSKDRQVTRVTIKHTSQNNFL